MRTKVRAALGAMLAVGLTLVVSFGGVRERARGRPAVV